MLSSPSHYNNFTYQEQSEQSSHVVRIELQCLAVVGLRRFHIFNTALKIERDFKQVSSITGETAFDPPPISPQQLSEVISRFMLQIAVTPLHYQLFKL